MPKYSAIGPREATNDAGRSRSTPVESGSGACPVCTLTGCPAPLNLTGFRTPQRLQLPTPPPAPARSTWLLSAGDGVIRQALVASWRKGKPFVPKGSFSHLWRKEADLD